MRRTEKVKKVKRKNRYYEKMMYQKTRKRASRLHHRVEKKTDKKRMKNG